MDNHCTNENLVINFTV